MDLTKILPILMLIVERILKPCKKRKPKVTDET